MLRLRDDRVMLSGTEAKRRWRRSITAVAPLSMTQLFTVTRRHRFLVLALASVAAGTFLIFITRGELTGMLTDRFRTCAGSKIYEKLSFPEMQKKYHYTMEQLVEERMRLYQGETLLQCDAKEMDHVVPPGEFASKVAKELPHVPNPPNFSFSDFELLLHEFWRMYDCHLDTVEPMPEALSGKYADESYEGHYEGYIDLSFVQTDLVARERLQARATFDRLMSVLRASEQYLPLHASLRCLQRGATDVRNAMSILSDASQCIPVRLATPETSLRR